MSSKASIILEIISATAVVISLVFVGIEIRNSSEQVEQNTQTLQITAYQDLISQIVEINAIGITESVTIESLIALKSPTNEDVQRLNSFLWLLFRHGDMAYFQYEKDAISEERLESAMAPVISRLTYPVVVARWETMQVAFVPAYREYIELHIKRITPQDPDT